MLTHKNHQQLTQIIYKQQINFINILTNNNTNLQINFIHSHYHNKNITIYILINISSHIKIKKSLQKITQTTKQTNQSKSIFLTTINHKLQTPLYNIINNLNLLQTKKLPKNINQLITTINNSSNLLLKIINNILNFSKIKSKQLKIKPHKFSPHKIINHITTNYLPLIIHKQLNLYYFIKPNIPITLNNNPIHLQQIISNLLNNTIKFTNTNYIILHIHTNNNYLSIHIHNTNIKIPTKKIIHLFNPFFQIKTNIQQNFQKTNLNLTIYKKLINIINNNISINSKPKINNQFTIHIPLYNTQYPQKKNIKKLNNKHY